MCSGFNRKQGRQRCAHKCECFAEEGQTATVLQVAQELSLSLVLKYRHLESRKIAYSYFCLVS